LIGMDYYEERQMPLLPDEEFYRVNAFDWKKEFASIFVKGGFDAVIGNPPYIRIQAMKEFAPTEIDFYKEKYKVASKGNYDIYVVFVEKGFGLINKNGRLGFILPSKFFATDYGESLRSILAEQQALEKIVDFGHLQVFEQATTYTCLLFLNGTSQNVFLHTRVDEPNALNAAEFREIESSLSGKPWVFMDKASKELTTKILANSKPLSELPTRIARGSSSGSDQVFILKKEGNSFVTKDGNVVDVEPEILRTPIYATDFGRYSFHPAEKEAIIFPYLVKNDGYELLGKSEFMQTYPKTYQYLLSRKKELEKRKQYKEWYSFSAPRNLDVHENAQFLVPLLANKGLYCRLLDISSKYCLMASGGFSITVGNESDLSPSFVLGLLNSKLLFWRLHSISNIFR